MDLQLWILLEWVYKHPLYVLQPLRNHINQNMHQQLSANILYQKGVAFDKPICPVQLLCLHWCHTRNDPQNNG